MSMSPEMGGAPTPKQPPRRWRGVVLIASLALNMALIAFLVVGALRGAPWSDHRERRMDTGAAGPVALILRDRPDDPALDAIRARYRPPMREALADIRAERDALARLMAAPGPVDPVAVDAALTRMELAGDRLQAVTGAAMREALPQLPEEARRRIFKRRD